MIKAKHTPGPWIPGSYTGFVRTRSGIAVAATYGQDGGSRIDDVMVANARLIAAAPEMLKALRAAHKWLLICDDTRSDDDLKKVEAALRHAEGQP